LPSILAPLARPCRLGLLGALMTLGATAALACPGASVATPVTSLPSIERQVMCVTCKIPLNVAQSPQADRERAFIQGLIERGETEAQIKRALLGQYGPAVLGLPSAHGFSLAVYLVPLAALLTLLAALVLLLPRWRHRSRAEAAHDAPPAALSSIDSARLDADLAQFD
jgi:cytochrome c-type biogenesis protein CcmH